MGSKKHIGYFLTVFFIAACSPKRDGIISRTYNAITAKYNILYNGNIAFQQGLDELSDGYQDNFWEQLEIEALQFKETSTQLSQLTNNSIEQRKAENKKLGPFDRAEEKAVKAIQLHSINIDGRERNSQMDEAYLLLGKSRYYTQRFSPAIDAFNYILSTDPKANLRDETKIWRAKANIRMNNEALAIETLSLVLKDPKISNETREKVHTTLAMAFQKAGNTQETIRQLSLATAKLTNSEQSARNLFVLGQMYAAENQKELAKKTFLKLANYKSASYSFKIHAQIEIAKNESNTKAIEPLILKFKKLMADGTNKKFEGELYYQMALLEAGRDSIERTISYLKKSLKSESTDANQKTYSYEKLGDFEFKRSNFLKAGSYYDSVLQINKNKQDSRIRIISRKYNNLANLIRLENLLKNNDSILRIVSLSKEDQKKFFENHIADLKAADQQRAQLALNSSTFGSSFSGGSAVQPNAKGKWYFYNTQLIAFGKAEFEKIWGTRPLEDNWRISDKTQLNTKTKDAEIVKDVNLAYELSAYLSAIPTKRIVLDSLTYFRNEALYETGIIYKEQFKNLSLAIGRLERLLTLNPASDLVLPTYYHLYQIFTELKSDQAEVYKNNIISKYPGSRFAQILLENKQLIPENKGSNIEALYRDIYNLYKENFYKEVVNQIDQLSPMLQESKLIAKFELLKAFAIGKYLSREAYKNALEFVSINYANLEEGIRAKELLKQIK